MTNQTPLNPAALEKACKSLWESQGNYPHKWENANPETAIYLRSKVIKYVSAYLAVAQPEVNSVEELESAIKRASTRAFDFMDQTNRGEFSTDGELFEHAFACGVQAVREETTRPEVKP